MEQLIRQVIATLDTVEVKGRDNLDKVLGCMQALEKIADAMRHNRETMNKITQEGEEQDVSGGV